MKIVHVLPITPGILKDALTYYTSKDVAENSLVLVPVRGKPVPALVVSAEEVSDVKSRLRSSSFSLKRVLRVAEKNFLLPEFVSAAEETARYFAGSQGGIIAGLVSSHILDIYMGGKTAQNSIPDCPRVRPKKEVVPENLQNIEKYAVQASDDDRFSVYRGIIREEFAKGSSVFIAASSTKAVHKIHRELGRGIEQYAFFLHGKLSQKEMLAHWKAVVSMDHPVLVVATPLFVSIPRPDFGVFILEEESRDAYQSFSRPYFDFRYFLECYADKSDSRFILGDLFLRVETLYRYEQKKLSSIIPLRFRMLSGLDQRVVDMKSESEALPRGEGFRIIGHTLRDALKETMEAEGRALLFGVRRGLASNTVCRDCGSVVTCQRCNVPYVLHREGARNIFICHKCEERKKSEIMCSVCGGWRLALLGVGVEQAAAEVREIFPDAQVLEFHADAIKTDKQRLETADAFRDSRRTVLVGTEMALPYVDAASLAGVISVDSLFSLPDFRIHEKTLRKLLEVKSKAEKTLIIQTRYPHEKLFYSILHGNLLEFYKNELEERRHFLYSPFSVIIKIHFDGTDDEVAEKGEYIQKTFTEYSVKIFPAFIPKIKDRYQVNAIIKIGAEKWPQNKLLAKLVSLPPYFRVKVEPEDLL